MIIRDENKATATTIYGRNQLRTGAAESALDSVSLEPDKDSRPKAKSDVERKRWSGCFSRQRCTMSRSPSEIAGAISDREGGSSFRIAPIVSTAAAHQRASHRE